MRGFRHMILLFFIGVVGRGIAQEKAPISIHNVGVSDTLISKPQLLPEVRVNQNYSRNYWRKYYRLVRKVKKVYPLAKKARVVVAEYEQEYNKYNKKRDRRRFAKGLEKALLKEYEPMIRKMKMSEGRILIRLIDREVNLTSYHIIKEFRGGFTAFIWQSVARIFRQDLKSKYDPYGEDYLIELIVQAIDRGEI
ncbi:DUF4294 domain-containing protein [Halosquirtibacter xylanolyticus]|uniref:DUF4294 domain-containing protein n=1 Tax=Halosquirtibacter xylanolyticus TaxID=3374599 RepID=UPI0037496F58|nr:DUF4294 domain-containing protein [Prolixibacteraceae bacterium]